MLKFQTALLSSAIFFSIAHLSTNAQSKSNIYIDVGKATIKRSLIALPPFQYFSSAKANKKHLAIGQELFNTVYNDLLVSSYFTFIHQNAFLEDVNKVSLKPAPGDPKGFKFQNWHSIGTEFLVRAGYKIIGQQLSLEAYVYYVPQAKLVLGKAYEGPLTTVRKMAHTFCNDMIKALTGKKGMFNSKIVVALSLIHI